MSSFRVAQRARLDLDEIWDYIADDSPPAADRLINGLQTVFATLAANPRLGQKRESLGAELRYIPAGSYLIFYRPQEYGIEILRVRHGARMVGPELFSP